MQIRCAGFLIVIVLVLHSAPILAQQGNRAQRIAATPNPYLLLIRDAAVHSELRLTADQKKAVTSLTDELDQPLLGLRNKPAKQADAVFQKLLAKAKSRLGPILNSTQKARLIQILLRVQGMKSLLRSDVSKYLKLSDDQAQKIESIIKETQSSIAELQKQAKAGKPVGPLEKEAKSLRVSEQKRILAAMNRTQFSQWSKLLGETFDVSKLGQFAFKAPELSGVKQWINSRPLTLQKLRGQVVALHFYAFG